jgi:hypothetical protein
MRVFFCFLCSLAAFPDIPAAELRIGIIGCDTSHAVAFTETLNNESAAGHIAGGKVVAAVKAGSPDINQSASRIDGFSKTLSDKYGVHFYETVEEMCSNVDAVLLESVDGRPHLEQVKPVLKARKPVFVDKPMAGSLRDVIEIFRLAKKAKVPVFSSSSLRFATNTVAVHNGFGQDHLCRDLWSMRVGTASPGSLLVRYSWSGGPLRDHGNRLHKCSAEYDSGGKN